MTVLNTPIKTIDNFNSFNTTCFDSSSWKSKINEITKLKKSITVGRY